MLSESEKEFYSWFDDSEEFIHDLEWLIKYISNADPFYFQRTESKKVKRELAALAKAIDNLSLEAEAHLELSNRQWDPHCISSLREALDQPYLKKAQPSTEISKFTFHLKKILNKYYIEFNVASDPDAVRFIAILLKHSQLNYTPEYVIDLLQ